MLDGSRRELLESQGFRQIGELAFRLRLSLWWHPEAKLQVIVLPLESSWLLKADKAYYLQSITEEGETWARDIGPLQSYLEAHLQELHLSFSFFRDIPKELAQAHIRRRTAAQTPTICFPSVGDLARLQRGVQMQQGELRDAEQLLELDSGSSGLLQSYGQRQLAELRRDLERDHRTLEQQKERADLFFNLQREYQRKGSAACLVFTASSNLHLTRTEEEFRDALVSVVKELQDLHRFQITQKLNGGRLNIQVKEAEEPVLTWIEAWFGGALSPRQLARLRSEDPPVREQLRENLVVTPNEDIRVAGSVREDQKLLGARVVSALLRRLDRPDPSGTNLQDLPEEAMPAKVGLVMAGDHPTSTSCLVPLAQLNNLYVSGSTGSGKSYFGRVLLEEAARHDLNILVLDPRNQAAGFLVAEDRSSILSLYPDFGMSSQDARGFDFQYFGPGAGVGAELPRDLGILGRGRSIVSFKGLDDRARCLLFAEILDAVFEAHVHQESSSLNLLLFVEEAQRFTKKRVLDEAKAAGQRAENALDRTVREGRKYGCCTVIVSQTIRDFAYDTASVRQNTTTKAFLHNSDREVDYAATFLGDGKQIIQLAPGTAIIHNAAWGVVKLKVRPPYSKVWELSTEDTRRLLTGGQRHKVTLSPEAEELLHLVHGHQGEAGTGPNLSRASKLLGITSKRRLQQLVEELERSGLVVSRRLRERGRPRVLEPVPSTGADGMPDGSGTEPGQTDPDGFGPMASSP